MHQDLSNGFVVTSDEPPIQHGNRLHLEVAMLINQGKMGHRRDMLTNGFLQLGDVEDRVYLGIRRQLKFIGHRT